MRFETNVIEATIVVVYKGSIVCRDVLLALVTIRDLGVHFWNSFETEALKFIKKIIPSYICYSISMSYLTQRDSTYLIVMKLK